MSRLIIRRPGSVGHVVAERMLGKCPALPPTEKQVQTDHEDVLHRSSCVLVFLCFVQFCVDVSGSFSK